MDKYKDLLMNYGISPSLHRINILKYLDQHRTHPTVDLIYQDLLKSIPTLSKTTVYNTLKTFTKKGIIFAISIFENESRYDFNIEPHAHFKCEICGSIFDLEKTVDLFQKNMIDGHLIKQHHVYLKGICKNCLEKENNA